MAKLNLSDQEILKHYKERKQVLNNELRRIETILNALGNETSSVEETKKRRYTRRNSANITKGPGRPRATKSGVAKAATAGIAKTAPKATSKTRGPGRPKVTKTAKAAASQKAPQATWDDKIKQALGKIGPAERSEEHTSELQSLMRNSYAVF